VIRLLIWIGVALALLGFFYKILDRSSGREQARREAAIKNGTPASASSARSAAVATPSPAPVVLPDSAPVVAPIATVADSRRIGRGLSFALADPATVPVRVAHLACHGEPAPIDRPHRGSCNPYQGDTSCRTVLPIACYRSSGAAAPANLEQDFYKGWTHGQLAATQPIMGAVLKSESDASALCEAELGAGWRMAEFHDGGGGWGLQGERQTGLRTGTRYWVHINDQRGNCWNSVP
jgi:hypothetical protein